MGMWMGNGLKGTLKLLLVSTQVVTFLPSDVWNGLTLPADVGPLLVTVVWWWWSLLCSLLEDTRAETSLKFLHKVGPSTPAPHWAVFHFIFFFFFFLLLIFKNLYIFWVLNWRNLVYRKHILNPWPHNLVLTVRNFNILSLYWQLLGLNLLNTRLSVLRAVFVASVLQFRSC